MHNYHCVKRDVSGIPGPVLLYTPRYSADNWMKRVCCQEPLVAMMNNPLRVLAREHLHFIPWATRYPFFKWSKVSPWIGGTIACPCSKPPPHWSCMSPHICFVV